MNIAWEIPSFNTTITQSFHSFRKTRKVINTLEEHEVGRLQHNREVFLVVSSYLMTFLEFGLVEAKGSVSRFRSNQR